MVTQLVTIALVAANGADHPSLAVAHLYVVWNFTAHSADCDKARKGWPSDSSGRLPFAAAPLEFAQTALRKPDTCGDAATRACMMWLMPSNAQDGLPISLAPCAERLDNLAQTGAFPNSLRLTQRDDGFQAIVETATASDIEMRRLIGLTRIRFSAPRFFPSATSLGFTVSFATAIRFKRPHDPNLRSSQQQEVPIFALRHGCCPIIG